MKEQIIIFSIVCFVIGFGSGLIGYNRGLKDGHDQNIEWYKKALKSCKVKTIRIYLQEKRYLQPYTPEILTQYIPESKSSAIENVTSFYIDSQTEYEAFLLPQYTFICENKIITVDRKVKWEWIIVEEGGLE